VRPGICPLVIEALKHIAAIRQVAEHIANNVRNHETGLPPFVPVANSKKPSGSVSRAPAEAALK